MASFKFKVRVTFLLTVLILALSVTLFFRVHDQSTLSSEEEHRDPNHRHVAAKPRVIERREPMVHGYNRSGVGGNDAGRIHVETTLRDPQHKTTRVLHEMTFRKANRSYGVTFAPKTDRGPLISPADTANNRGLSKLSENNANKDGVGCLIPDLNPFDKTVAEFIKGVPPYPDCKFNASLTYIDSMNRIRFNKTVAAQTHRNRVKSCFYHTYAKHNQNDDLANYSTNFHQFSDASEPLSADFVRVLCLDVGDAVIYENMHAIINTDKRNVMQKIRNWTKKLEKDQALKKSPPLNVILLGFDSVSRSNFIRSLPKTYDYLTKELSAFVFKGMNKVHDNTFPNLVPLLTGLSVGKSSVYPPDLRRYQWKRDVLEYYDDYPIIWRNFSARGYVTMMAEDREEMSTFNYMARGFKAQPTDYYLRPLYLGMRDSPVRKISRRHCHGGDHLHKVIFDYLFRFVKIFHNAPTFSHTFLSDLSHEYLNSIKFADNDILHLIKGMKDAGYLENTLLVIFADHGHRFDDIRRTLVGRVEERLPFFSMTFPKQFLKDNPKVSRSLAVNTERLVTFFDVHRTFLDIINFEPEKIQNKAGERGMSLFDEIPTSRTCEDAHIEQHYCACQRQKPISVRSELVINGAAYLVANLNLQLSRFKNLCATLQLAKIHHSYEIAHGKTVLKERVGYDDKETTAKFAFKELVIVLETLPGGALFEATLRYDVMQNSFASSGDISRINKYGNQSICIEDAVLRKFCFCKK